MLKFPKHAYFSTFFYVFFLVLLFPTQFFYYIHNTNYLCFYFIYVRGDHKKFQTQDFDWFNLKISIYVSVHFEIYFNTLNSIPLKLGTLLKLLSTRRIFFVILWLNWSGASFLSFLLELSPKPQFKFKLKHHIHLWCLKKYIKKSVCNILAKWNKLMVSQNKKLKYRSLNIIHVYKEHYNRILFQ